MTYKATSTFSLFGILKLCAVKKLKLKVYVEIESQPTQMFQHSKLKTQIYICEVILITQLQLIWQLTISTYAKPAEVPCQPTENSCCFKFEVV